MISNEKLYASIMCILVVCMIALMSTVTIKMWTGSYNITTTIDTCPKITLDKS